MADEPEENKSIILEGVKDYLLSVTKRREQIYNETSLAARPYMSLSTNIFIIFGKLAESIYVLQMLFDEQGFSLPNNLIQRLQYVCRDEHNMYYFGIFVKGTNGDRCNYRGITKSSPDLLQ